MKEKGDVVFIDGKGLDGTLETEALRICADGTFRIRGVVETDSKVIVRALCDWTVRCLDSVHPPTIDVPMPADPILPDEGKVTIQAKGGSSIVLDVSGDVLINGVPVGHDSKLRQNVRRVLERLRTGQQRNELRVGLR